MVDDIVAEGSSYACVMRHMRIPPEPKRREPDMLSEAERAMAEMMARQFGGDAGAAVEPADEGASRITFFERSNRSDSTVGDVVARMTFSGAFAIDEFMIQRKDGTPVEAGFGADFDDAGGPTAAWVWFSRPVNEAVKSKFEERFGAAFDAEGVRMDITPDEFTAFSDSGCWQAFEEDEEDGEGLF